MTDPSGNPYPLNNKDMYGRPGARPPNWEYQPTDTSTHRSGAAPSTAGYRETREDDRRRDPQASFMPRGRDSRDEYAEPEPRSHSRRPRDGRRGQIEDDKITHTGARESFRNRRRDRSTHRNEIDTSGREPARTGAGTRPEGRRDHSRRPAGESAPRSRSQIRQRSTIGERRLVTTGTTRDGRGREEGRSRPPSRTRTPGRPRVSSRVRPSSQDRDSRERRDHHGSRTRRPMTERARRSGRG
jgi:hypothetical protein